MKHCSIYFLCGSAGLAMTAVVPAQVLPSTGSDQQLKPMSVSAAGLDKKPLLTALSHELDLGRVPSGKVVLHEFRYRNAGNAALEIDSIGVGCGCTVVGDYSRRVEPGGEGGVSLAFTVPGVDGAFHKTLNLASNDPEHPQTVFAVKGIAWKIFETEPPQVSFDRVEREPPGNPIRVRLVNRSEPPVTLKEAHSSLSGIGVTLTEKSKGREYEILVEPKDGVFSQGGGQITIGCSMKDVPQISLPLVVRAVPALTLSPAEVVLKSNPLESPEVFRLALRSASTRMLEIPKVIQSPDGVQVAVREVEAGRLFCLEVTIPAGWTLPEGRTALIGLQTTHPNFPRMEIPLLRRGTGDHAAFQEVPSGKVSALGAPTFDSKIHDFGLVPAGAVIGHDFAFSVPDFGGSVQILRVDSCSSKGLVRDWSRTVDPGKTGNVSLALDTSGLEGPVEIAFLLLAGNADGPAIELRLKAEICQSAAKERSAPP